MGSKSPKKCLSVAENPENFNTWAINLKRHASKQEVHGGNHGEISASKSTGKYAKAR